MTAASPENASGGACPKTRRLLVVSHPAVLTVNQQVYRELSRRGWDVTLVVPNRWRHSFSGSDFAPQALAGMETALAPAPVALHGRPQRYFFRASAGRIARRAAPDVAFLEAEPFAVCATQWGRALSRLRVPFGVQCYENIDRACAFPGPVQLMRSQVLSRASFVAARSATAARLARTWGAIGEVGLAPPAVPTWELAAGDPTPRRPGGERDGETPFRIGFAGRFVESKGILDLLAAVRLLAPPLRLVLVGTGELDARLEAERVTGCEIEVLRGIPHEQMGAVYRRMDVLVLPSRTTPTWKEQFGRVIVEALSCGVPVVGSDSGEIPWLIGLTEGGLVFPEGNVVALAQRLATLRADRALRLRLADAGAAAVERMFSIPAATDALERLLDNAIAIGRGTP
jgi:glycosyltransferase involved in cell wall biosynthesis